MFKLRLITENLFLLIKFSAENVFTESFIIRYIYIYIHRHLYKAKLCIHMYIYIFFNRYILNTHSYRNSMQCPKTIMHPNSNKPNKKYQHGWFLLVDRPPLLQSLCLPVEGLVVEINNTIIVISSYLYYIYMVQYTYVYTYIHIYIYIYIYVCMYTHTCILK